MDCYDSNIGCVPLTFIEFCVLIHSQHPTVWLSHICSELLDDTQQKNVSFDGSRCDVCLFTLFFSLFWGIKLKSDTTNTEEGCR